MQVPDSSLFFLFLLHKDYKTLMKKQKGYFWGLRPLQSLPECTKESIISVHAPFIPYTNSLLVFKDRDCYSLWLWLLKGLTSYKGSTLSKVIIWSKQEPERKACWNRNKDCTSSLFSFFFFLKKILKAFATDKTTQLFSHSCNYSSLSH